MAEARTHLIWSNKRACWHRRSADGGACGYTLDIADAGIFETSTAMAYDDGPDGDDHAITIAEAAEGLRRRLASLDAQRVSLAETINQLEAA